MTSKLTPRQAALAAELALGVLEGDERAEALRLLLASPHFAKSVAEWHETLDPLGAGFEEAPPPNVWHAIEARLDGDAPTGQIRQLRFWRGFAGAAGALAATLAAIMVFGPATLRETPVSVAADVRGQTVIAQLSGADGTLLAANISPQTGQVDIRAVALPETRLTPELWVIPADGVPRSLGLIARSGTTNVTLPENLRPLVTDGALLAVSLEKIEGAPHTAPSSTPIAVGKISAI